MATLARLYTEAPTNPFYNGLASGDIMSILDANFSALNNPVGYLVASSMAPLYIKAIAYKVCDGVNDDVEIQEAVTDAAAAGVYDVQLSGGFFFLGQNAIPDGLLNVAYFGVSLPGQTYIHGAGRFATMLQPTGSFPANTSGHGNNFYTAFVNAHTNTGGDNYIQIERIGFSMRNSTYNSTVQLEWDVFVNFWGASYTTVRDCYGINGSFDFFPLSSTFDTSSALTNGNNTRNLVEHCEITNVTGSNSFFQGTNSTFQNNSIYKTWDDPFLVGSAGYGHKIINNVIDASPVVSAPGLAGMSGCIYLDQDSGVVNSPEAIHDILIQGNTCKNAALMGFGQRTGINLVGQMRDIVVRENICFNNVNGIRCLDSMNRQDVLIAKNNVNNNTSDGIVTQANLQNGIVQGVILEDNDVWDNVGNGWYTYSYGTLEVKGVRNRFYNKNATTQTTSIGINSEASPYYNQIQLMDNECLNANPVSLVGAAYSKLSSFRNNIGINPDSFNALGNITGANTVSRVNGVYQSATLTGNVTLTIPNGIFVGDELTLELKQDATGSRTISWPSNFKKAGGTLALSTAANATDVVKMRWDKTNWVETSRALNIS